MHGTHAADAAVAAGRGESRGRKASFHDRLRRARFTSVSIVSATSLGSSCSQKRRTVHPASASRSLASASRLRFFPIFSCQYSACALGGGEVSGAAVPEAPVDEHGHLDSGEDDVRFSADGGVWSHIDSVAHAAHVQELPNGQLRTRVARSICLHRFAGLLVGRPGVRWHTVCRHIKSLFS